MPRDPQSPHDAVRHRVDERNRAFERVSRITTATALAGAFATVGFGGLAAATYSGNSDSSSDTVTTDDSVPGVQGFTATPAPPTARAPGATVGPPATNAPGTSNRQPVSVPPPTATRGRSHSTTGGSGR